MAIQNVDSNVVREQLVSIATQQLNQSVRIDGNNNVDIARQSKKSIIIEDKAEILEEVQKILEQEKML